MQMDRTVKGMRPVLHAAIVMRMRDRDRDEAAHCANQRFGRIVEQRNTVPEDITLRGPQKQRALADAKSRLGMDLEQIRFQAPPGVGVPARKPRWRYPSLSATWHILPFIFTDQAAGGGSEVSG